MKNIRVPSDPHPLRPHHFGEILVERCLNRLLTMGTEANAIAYHRHTGSRFSEETGLLDAIREQIGAGVAPVPGVVARAEQRLTHPLYKPDSESRVDCAILNPHSGRSFPIEIKMGTTGQGASWEAFYQHNFDPIWQVCLQKGSTTKIKGRVPSLLARLVKVRDLVLSDLCLNGEPTYSFSSWGLCVRRCFIRAGLNGDQRVDWRSAGAVPPIIFCFEDLVKPLHQEFEIIMSEILAAPTHGFLKEYDFE